MREEEGLLEAQSLASFKATLETHYLAIEDADVTKGKVATFDVYKFYYCIMNSPHHPFAPEYSSTYDIVALHNKWDQLIIRLENIEKKNLESLSHKFFTLIGYIEKQYFQALQTAKKTSPNDKLILGLFLNWRVLRKDDQKAAKKLLKTCDLLRKQALLKEHWKETLEQRLEPISCRLNNRASLYQKKFSKEEKKALLPIQELCKALLAIQELCNDVLSCDDPTVVTTTEASEPLPSYTEATALEGQGQVTPMPPPLLAKISETNYQNSPPPPPVDQERPSAPPPPVDQERPSAPPPPVDQERPSAPPPPPLPQIFDEPRPYQYPAQCSSIITATKQPFEVARPLYTSPSPTYTSKPGLHVTSSSPQSQPDLNDRKDTIINELKKRGKTAKELIYSTDIGNDENSTICVAQLRKPVSQGDDQQTRAVCEFDLTNGLVVSQKAAISSNDIIISYGGDLVGIDYFLEKLLNNIPQYARDSYYFSCTPTALQPPYLNVVLLKDQQEQDAALYKVKTTVPNFPQRRHFFGRIALSPQEDGVYRVQPDPHSGEDDISVFPRKGTDDNNKTLLGKTLYETRRVSNAAVQQLTQAEATKKQRELTYRTHGNNMLILTFTAAIPMQPPTQEHEHLGHLTPSALYTVNKVYIDFIAPIVMNNQLTAAPDAVNRYDDNIMVEMERQQQKLKQQKSSSAARARSRQTPIVISSSSFFGLTTNITAESRTPSSSNSVRP